MDFRAGMFVYALAFLSGVVYVQQLAVLPALSKLLVIFIITSLTVVLLVLLYYRTGLASCRGYTLTKHCIILFIIGYLYASFSARLELSHRLDHIYVGSNILVTGTVSDIPATDDEVQRFNFVVTGWRLLSSDNPELVQKNGLHSFPEKLRLSWYYGIPVNAGEQWRFEVRLKPPHGFMNPGGFDYEAWLFQHGIHATGYVRQSSLNRKLSSTSASLLSARVDSYRQLIGQQIDSIAIRYQGNNSGEPETQADGTGSYALVKALATGDRSSMSNRQWQVLANTGTSHLMAISGLHIGLASLFAYVLVRRTLPAFLFRYIPAQHIAISCGMVTALAYAMLAGLSVSTQRAIIMLCVLALMMLLRRNYRPVDALGFALLLVLLFDPLAVLSAGLWFSFAAVAVIFIIVNTGNCEHGEDSGKNIVSTCWQNIISRIITVLRQWSRLQIAISVFLLPMSLFMFHQASLIAPLVNFLLIPYVSFLVVPVVLAALVCDLLFPAIAQWLFTLAAGLLDFVWPLLAKLSELSYAIWMQGDFGIASLLILTLAILLIFYARKTSRLIDAVIFNGERLAGVYIATLVTVVLMSAPVFIDMQPRQENGEFRLTLLDVGQGLSVLVNTRNHLMVFDAGARFSDRLDAGSSVVVPYIRSLGFESLDVVMVSHGDADHIGGARAILNEFPAARLIGQDIDGLHAKTSQHCFAGMKWHWDGVDFEILSPARNDAMLFSKDKRNNHSCVLKAGSGAGSVLLTGDIEQPVEAKLLANYGERLAADVLIVPHHGSKTSSSPAFITAVKPVLSLFSTGYNNRYHFPAGEVVQRYESLDSDVMQTDSSGAIIIDFSNTAGMNITEHRKLAGKYWHHRMQ